MPISSLFFGRRPGAAVAACHPAVAQPGRATLRGLRAPHGAVVEPAVRQGGLAANTPYAALLPPLRARLAPALLPVPTARQAVVLGLGAVVVAGLLAVSIGLALTPLAPLVLTAVGVGLLLIVGAVGAAVLRARLFEAAARGPVGALIG